MYQVFVDRFAPPANLHSKLKWIKPPRTLKPWSETPKPGHPLPDLGLWSHELDFWGGDLASLMSKLGYIRGLGANVLYLTPIDKAFTNHRYDTQDYMQVSPELGTRQEVKALAKTLHGEGMKLMLDGVFNHMGRTSPLFEEAAKNPNSLHRNWFYFGGRYPNGYRTYAGVKNMPELRLETPAVRSFLWNGPQSVVRSWLRDGVDGWRLDVAYNIGPAYLGELTRAAHQTKPGSAVVGEISGYPSDWFPSVDGVFNFFEMNVVRQAVAGEVSGGRASLMLNQMVEDAGLDRILKSWLLLDNHDTPRFASVVPDAKTRDLIRTLQFTLPGSPVIYYGTELGMKGDGDPANRAPMRWDLVKADNPDLASTRRLVKIHNSHPALRYGDFQGLATERLLAFSRTTDRLRDSVIVVLNPTDQPVKETFPTRIGWLMSWGGLRDLLTGARAVSVNGMLTVDMKPKSAMILAPDLGPLEGSSPYFRIP